MLGKRGRLHQGVVARLSRRIIVMKMQRLTAAPSAARRGEAMSVLRCANRVCKSSIAVPRAKKIIGQSTKNHVNNEPPIYAMKRCSRTSRLRRTVPSAFYLCKRICCPVPRFHLRLYSYPPRARE